MKWVELTCVLVVCTVKLCVQTVLRAKRLALGKCNLRFSQWPLIQILISLYPSANGDWAYGPLLKLIAVSNFFIGFFCGFLWGIPVEKLKLIAKVDAVENKMGILTLANFCRTLWAPLWRFILRVILFICPHGNVSDCVRQYEELCLHCIQAVLCGAAPWWWVILGFGRLKPENEGRHDWQSLQ